jgi:hypothetical protein
MKMYYVLGRNSAGELELVSQRACETFQEAKRVAEDELTFNPQTISVEIVRSVDECDEAAELVAQRRNEAHEEALKMNEPQKVQKVMYVKIWSGRTGDGVMEVSYDENGVPIVKTTTWDGFHQDFEVGDVPIYDNRYDARRCEDWVDIGC